MIVSSPTSQRSLGRRLEFRGPTVLKMYQRGSTTGDSAAFWELNWSEDRLEEAVRFCSVDPLKPLFEQHAPPGSRMLEGGCGQGQYVIYCAAQRINVVGLDFARDTLARLQRRRPDLLLCAGNVADLPFRSTVFDVYYSGGVVEHFEGGALPALREAWRVLRPGGVLLVSVPYYSPLRRALAPFRGRLWKRVAQEGPDGVSQGDRRFWQYAYSQAEFTRLLSSVGFCVILRQGYSILWGLYDLPLIAGIVDFLQRRRGNRGEGLVRTVSGEASEEAPRQPPQPAGPSAPAQLSLLKRLAVAEDATVPLAGPFVRGLRATCANMMMYVCER
jgi:SAM-dependent methyltransferase